MARSCSSEPARRAANTWPIKPLVGDKVAQATRRDNADAQVCRTALDGPVQRESQVVAARRRWLVRGKIGIDEDGNDRNGPLSHDLGYDGSVGMSQASRFIVRGNLSHPCHVEALVD